MSTFRRWVMMACLSLSGGIIFLLPFLREVYYIPLQRALNLSNTQLGILMSVFGVAALLTYFPGGWLADRVSSRKLITFSMLATGLAGILLRDFPFIPAVHCGPRILGNHLLPDLLGGHDQGDPKLGARH